MRYLHTIGFEILFLTACVAGGGGQATTPPVSAIEEVHPTVTAQNFIDPTSIPTGNPTPHEIVPVPTEIKITPQPTFQVCSPLEMHPLEELPSIIGDPYDPPRPGREERHHGIDFAYYHYKDRDSMRGEPVQSILSGVVASVLDGNYPYGNMLIIETKRRQLPEPLVEKLNILPGQSLYILYAHLDQPPLPRLGDLVQACQSIGEVGMSGNTDIPHLHIETRLGPADKVFESMRFYDTRATQAEMDTYVLWRTSGFYKHFDPMELLGVDTEP
jgi:murein DD-endopeptidase MepM/ murein hydrolase activator NlpD